MPWSRARRCAGWTPTPDRSRPRSASSACPASPPTPGCSRSAARGRARRSSWQPPRARSGRRSDRSRSSRVARAVGIAGDPDKVRALTEEFGFDVGVDHRADDFRERLADAVPDGIDVYFENVGGAVFGAVRKHLNLYARIPVCGLVSGYNETEPPGGPDRMPGLMRQVLTKSLTIAASSRASSWRTTTAASSVTCPAGCAR